MAIEIYLYAVVGLLMALGVFDCGYRLGKLRGIREAATSSCLRLSVLTNGPKSALERL